MSLSHLQPSHLLIQSTLQNKRHGYSDRSRCRETVDTKSGGDNTLTGRTFDSQSRDAEQWQYQVRINLADEAVAAARSGTDDPSLKPLNEILDKHNAVLKCQYDIFTGYCAEAEQHGIEHYPLYAWTKATINNPAKKAKYVKAFTIYVDGEEVYARNKADALEQDLALLVGGPIVMKMAKHDTNPANNPQPPKRYRP